ncbi:MAG: hypothetical protein ACTHLE_26720 [Agriterribacter sp.]
MKLDHLYSLRREFTVIGLTGRTGSGCTQIAEILSGTFEKLQSEGLRDLITFDDSVFRRKYNICRKYLQNSENWSSFEVIKYLNVLLFFILNKYGGNNKAIEKLLKIFFKLNKDENNSTIVDRTMVKIITIDRKYSKLIKQIKKISNFKTLKTEKQLLGLHSLFFGDAYSNLVDDLLKALEKAGYYRTRLLLHRVGCNIRASGDPLLDQATSIEYIYSIADLINRLIKAKGAFNKRFNKPTKIVIDSLRNSLEIMFFKQRFSAFYMVATKDVLGREKDRITNRLKTKITDPKVREDTVLSLLKLDAVEYRTKDFSKGIFSSPDVENCIQKSDFHIINLRRADINQYSAETVNAFLTREEQIMKLLALIAHPGLITPSAEERAMQMANTAKLNSGCISRKVGAVITDAEYNIKSIGWNDVAKGHTPCNLRDVTDFFNDETLKNSEDYSDFEKGNCSSISSYKYKNENPGNFKDAIIDYFKSSFEKKENDLKGKTCSFCFKTVHNQYEGEANQVHTRSLHAEEQAMLQITKLGGVGVKGGYLFTTASPCELCSKKAYELGVQKIFYIDPYPGIAVDQILKAGKMQPKLMPFSGAIGNAYDWLYESFMSFKDEITMTLELQPKPNFRKEFKNLLENSSDSDLKYFASMEITDAEIKEIIISGLKKKKKEVTN